MITLQEPEQIINPIRPFVNLIFYGGYSRHHNRFSRDMIEIDFLRSRILLYLNTQDVQIIDIFKYMYC